MKVKDIMTVEPRICSSSTSVAAAAREMWDGDCGILPVVDDGRLVGIVTDRDMYIALATRNARAAELNVGDVATRVVVSCRPEDEVQDALGLMKRALVRRLPVLGPDAEVLGIVSIDDIVKVAGARRPVRNDDVVDTLRTLAAQHHPLPRFVAA